MGRAPCCDKANVKKGPWSPEEDSKLKDFIDKHGTGGNWIALPQKAGLKRCGKSCRLRWLNYLRPNIKHGEFTDDEDRIICTLFATIGSRWSIIAAQLPGRTDNDIKNYWNTKLKKKLLGISSSQRKPHHQQQQQHFYPSCFETSAVASSASPSSQGSCYTTPKPLFTNLEGYSISQDLLSPASCTAASPSLMQYHVKESGSLLMFGADQQSCSSSDGSCNQISYAKEAADIEYNGGGEQLVFENYLYGGLQDNQKLLFSTMGRSSSGLWGDTTTLEYTYEDIKQLLSPNPNTNPSIGANSLFMEGPSSASRTSSSFKHQGRVMY